jgi:hypothetical protein
MTENTASWYYVVQSTQVTCHWLFLKLIKTFSKMFKDLGYSFNAKTTTHSPVWTCPAQGAKVRTFPVAADVIFKNATLPVLSRLYFTLT